MFRETLIESATSSHKRKRWPMAMAFSAEVVVATLLVVLPLLSTGVITVSAHAPKVTPLRSFRIIDHVAEDPGRAPGIPGARTLVVTLNNTLTWGIHQPVESDNTPDPGPNLNIGSTGPSNLPIGCFSCQPPALKHVGPIRLSVISEGQLVNRVDPVYPRIAVLTGTQGQVRLHAIIAKDGSIQSLNVVSGHPMLVAAAVDAVRQWRYRPYYLNGEAVEVETFITVNFKKTNE